MPARVRLGILILSAAMALGAVLYAWAVHHARGPRIALDGNSLRLQGPIVDESVDAALQLLALAPQKVERVVLRSQGGDMRAAMRLGLVIFERGLAVEVDGYCVAACASYLFTAARRKLIRDGSLVAWFGSARQPEFLDGSWEVRWRQMNECQTTTPDCETRLERLRTYISAAASEQQAFFQRISVDPRLVEYGQREQPCACSWTFDLEDMRSFGVDQVQLESAQPYFSDLGYWARQVLQEHQIRLLKLNPSVSEVPQ